MIERLAIGIDPRKLSNARVVQIAEQLTRAYAWMHADYPPILFTINFDHVFDTMIYPNLSISLEEDVELGEANGEKVLGSYDPFSDTISLDAILNDSSDLTNYKRAFTAWHELAHAILHGNWLRTWFSHRRENRIETVETSLSRDATKRIEQQANLFASRAAAPEWFLDYVLKSTFRLTRPFRYIGPATYWLDVRGVRKLCPVTSLQELCMVIAYQLRHRFGGLSIEALTYRIQESRWVLNTLADSKPIVKPPKLLRTTPRKASRLLVTV